MDEVNETNEQKLERLGRRDYLAGFLAQYLRPFTGMSASGACKAAGFSISVLSSFFTGQTGIPKPETLIALAPVLEEAAMVAKQPLLAMQANPINFLLEAGYLSEADIDAFLESRVVEAGE